MRRRDSASSRATARASAGSARPRRPTSTTGARRCAPMHGRRCQPDRGGRRPRPATTRQRKVPLHSGGSRSVRQEPPDVDPTDGGSFGEAENLSASRRSTSTRPPKRTPSPAGSRARALDCATARSMRASWPPDNRTRSTLSGPVRASAPTEPTSSPWDPHATVECAQWDRIGFRFVKPGWTRTGRSHLPMTWEELRNSGRGLALTSLVKPGAWSWSGQIGMAIWQQPVLVVNADRRETRALIELGFVVELPCFR